MLQIKRLENVNLLTGKYKGRQAVFCCYTERNDDTLAQVSVQTGLGWKTILVHPKNITVK